MAAIGNASRSQKLVSIITAKCIWPILATSTNVPSVLSHVLKV